MPSSLKTMVTIAVAVLSIAQFCQAKPTYGVYGVPGGSISVRVPPTLWNKSKPYPGWVAPPPGFYYGTWTLTHSTSYQYSLFRNMEASISPLPGHKFPGPNNDLTDWQLLRNASNNPAVVNTIISAYGVDYPRPNPPTKDAPDGLGLNWGYGPNGWSWQYNVTGALEGVQNIYEFVGYGKDPRTGSEWVLLHETLVEFGGSPPALDFECRMYALDSKGTSKECKIHDETVKEILAAVKALKNRELTTLAGKVIPLVHDGARDGMVIPYPCDMDCKNNTVLGAQAARPSN